MTLAGLNFFLLHGFYLGTPQVKAIGKVDDSSEKTISSQLQKWAPVWKIIMEAILA